jgi:hypothetical protein
MEILYHNNAQMSMVFVFIYEAATIITTNGSAMGIAIWAATFTTLQK